jgi:hypothetical protein
MLLTRLAPTLRARRAHSVRAAPLLALLAAACGDAPDPAKLELARQSIAVATEIGADIWAPEELAEAQDLLAQAEAEYKRQDRALRKKQRDAHQLALRAAELARVATDAAQQAAREVAASARASLGQAELLIDESESALAALVRCRPTDLPSNLRELAADLEASRAHISRVKEQLASEDYGGAAGEGPTLIAGAQSLRDRVDVALRRTGCR